MRRLIIFALVALALLGIGLGVSLSSTAAPRSTRYGPPSAGFAVAFGVRPEVRDWQRLEATNTLFKGMLPRFTLYVASLGANAYESVSTLVYARPLSAAQVHWYLHDYQFGSTRRRPGTTCLPQSTTTPVERVTPLSPAQDVSPNSTLSTAG